MPIKKKLSLTLLSILLLMPAEGFAALGDPVITASTALEVPEEELEAEEEIIEQEDEDIIVNQVEVAAIASSAGLSEPSVISTSLADVFVEAEVDLAAANANTQIQAPIVPIESETQVQTGDQTTTVGLNQDQDSGSGSGSSGSTTTLPDSNTQIQAPIVPIESETQVQTGNQTTTVGLNQDASSTDTSSSDSRITDNSNDAATTGNAGNFVSGDSNAASNRFDRLQSQKSGRRKMRSVSVRHDNEEGGERRYEHGEISG